MVGYEIISIDGTHCSGLSINEVEKLFEKAPGSFLVMADDPMDTQRRRLSLHLDL